jgi:hypothetical protein
MTTASLSIAAEDLAAHLKVAALFDCPLNLAQIEAVRQVRQAHGIDFSAHLLTAPAQQNIKPQGTLLNPAELGKLFGCDAKGMNKILQQTGLQTKADAGWEPTPKGRAMCIKHYWTDGKKSGHTLEWHAGMVKAALNSPN